MIIGIDAGGSKTHGVVYVDGKIVKECTTGGANIRNDYEAALKSISEAINILLAGYLCDQCEIKIGVAGYSHIQHRNRLQVDLNQKYKNVKINSDAYIACLAAHRGNDGGVLICGTGVVGYIKQNQQCKQLGGFGFPHGDLGGGAYLGLEISKMLCKALDGIIPMSPMLSELYEGFNNDYMQTKNWLIQAKVADYALIAKVLEKHIDHDSNAKKILHNAVLEIEQLLLELYKSKLPIKLYGGLAKIYFPYLKTKFTELEICDVSAAHGALYL